MNDIHKTCKINIQKAIDKIERLEKEITSLQTIIAQHDKWCGFNPKNIKESTKC